MLEKTYNPATLQARYYDRWETSKAFEAKPESDLDPYTIMMPPPMA